MSSSRVNPYELPRPEIPPFGKWYRTEGAKVGNGIAGYFPIFASVGELRERWADEPTGDVQVAVSELLTALHEAMVEPLPKRSDLRADRARFARFSEGLARVESLVATLSPGDLPAETTSDVRYIAKLVRIAETGYLRAHHGIAADVERPGGDR